jgi:hypothetical protein
MCGDQPIIPAKERAQQGQVCAKASSRKLYIFTERQVSDGESIFVIGHPVETQKAAFPVVPTEERIAEHESERWPEKIVIE